MESPSGTLRAVAGAEAAGGRTDRFLADSFQGLSRARVKALIAAGLLSRDGAVLRDPSAPVRAGAAYALAVPAPAPATPVAQHIPLSVLFEDSDLIVVDKPPGLVVHPAPGNPDGTLVNALIAHCGGSLTGIGGEARPGIVHRLDKDTSGVMVAAKTQAAHEALSRLFASRAGLERRYLAAVWGLPPAEGRIEAPIGRDPAERKRMAVVARGGKPAVTHFRRVEAFGTTAALLECRLETGRTHQIRVHLAHAGHPLLGDPVYLRRLPAAARALKEEMRRELSGFPRQALHAASLGFVHPTTGAALRFEAPLPADIEALLGRLRALAG
ncbi:MAG: RluA family pseudouridine synthase [Acetobacteraceae bacterium]|nr:RluA family pseudouridine synthase [Acetobacteraceae bacterium]